MKRLTWSSLLCAAALAIFASSARAAGEFPTFAGADEISSLVLGTSGGTLNDLVEMGNLGLVITDVADSRFYEPSNGTGTTMYSGSGAIVRALLDGSTTSPSTPASSLLGIVPYNNTLAGSGSYTGFYGVGYATAAELEGFGQATFGGYLLSSLPANALCLRETWRGDPTLAGNVTPNGNQVWSLSFGSPNSYPADWAHGYYALSNVVGPNDNQIWNLSYGANLPSLGSSAGVVQSAGAIAAVPEPATVLLLLIGVVTLFGFGVVKRIGNTLHRVMNNRGTVAMRKCLGGVSAMIAVLLMVTVARADYIEYTTAIDSVYTSSGQTAASALASSAYTLNTATNTLTFKTAQSTAYVKMAILATIVTSASDPISQDGINTAYLNFVGSANSSMGTDGYYTSVTSNTNAAYLNPGTLVNANTAANPGNPGETNYTAKRFKQNWGTPLQASGSPAVGTTQSPSYVAPKVQEWPAQFTGNSGQEGGHVTTSTNTSFIIGKTGAYSSSDASSGYGAAGPGFYAYFTPNNLLSNAVTYSSTAASSAVVTGDPAVQPGNGSYSYLIGATGISSTSATFILGQLDYKFTGATSGGTAQIQAIPATVQSNFLQFSTDALINGTQVIASGPTSNVLAGPVALIIDGTNSSSAPSAYLNFPSAITATPSFAIAGGTNAAGVAFSGGTSTIAGVLTNTQTGGSTQDSVASWKVTGGALHGSFSAANVSSQTLALNGTAPVSLTYTAPTNFFGNDILTLTPSGVGTATPAVNVSAGTVAINVIGLGNYHSNQGDGHGAPGSYGNVLTSPSIASGGSYAGLQATIGTAYQTSAGTDSVQPAIGNTFAIILAGTNGSSSSPVTMQWRARAQNEVPGGTGQAGNLPLSSDVVNISGIGGSTPNTANAYALEVSFDPTQLTGGSAGVATAFTNGLLYLGAYNGSKWVSAVNTALNGAAGGNAVTQFDGSWAAFQTAGNGANGHSLASLVGSWGVDTVNDTAWAVVDYSGNDFAVVPEPGTLALLAAGVCALGVAYRRRKVTRVAPQDNCEA